ncbi:hypothetical protein CFIO01_07825 [Colletotrichum fioriniae PJ7]|uniref:Uncharacterized protein n=1 Tax=Colletotrichum fioriniae PJ7 TaxID=1445577 RepID=A0A010QBL9_9PEZI|nr:hypothetical protein CFIO01_07825 [Colletotrichum fioriniae PJ7]
MRIYSLTLPSPSPCPPHSLHDATLCICAPGVILSDSPRNLLQPRRAASYLTPSFGLETEPCSPDFEVAARADKPNNTVTKRQVSISGGQTTNLTVGVTVGVAILVFILGAGAFLYYYRVSLKKISRRRHRRRRRHHSHKSYSSRSSKSSAGDGPASHPPPPGPPSAPRSTAPSATPADPPADAPADAPADPPADIPADPPAEK